MLKDILTVAAIIICGIALAFVGWKIKRWVNYKFDYSSQVEETVRELVKKECLR